MEPATTDETESKLVLSLVRERQHFPEFVPPHMVVSVGGNSERWRPRGRESNSSMGQIDRSYREGLETDRIAEWGFA